MPSENSMSGNNVSTYLSRKMGKMHFRSYRRELRWWITGKANLWNTRVLTMRHPRGIWNLCLEGSLWLDHAAMVCLRQIYCNNEPGCLLFQCFKCWLFQQQSLEPQHENLIYHGAAARDAQEFGWIWSVGNNWQNWVAEEQKMDLKSSFEIQFKSKEHKVSLTHR